MLFFDWGKVRQAAKNDPYDIIKVLHYIVYHPVAKNLYDVKTKVYSYTDFRGTSFLKTPKLFLDEECRYNIKYSITYLDLASKRSYLDYKYYKELRLPIILSNKPIDWLSKNPLLTIDGDFIKFNLEI